MFRNYTRLLSMSLFNFRLPFSPVSLCISIVAVFMVTYIGLIAVIMSYAASTVEFTQSVRNDESVIAALEAAYLADVARVTTIDYVATGYVKPIDKIFIRAESVTALR